MQPWTWLAVALAVAAPAAATAGGPQVVFHAPWDGAARTELPARLPGRVFSPLWVSLTDSAGTLRVADDPASRLPAVRRARVMPLVTNAHDGVWDRDAAIAVFANPRVRSKVANGLADLAGRKRWAGVVLDFEALPPADMPAYAAFVAEVRAALARRGKAVWVTALLSAETGDQRMLQDAADRLVLMAYDECWATSTPGPVAGEDWLETLLARRLPSLNPRKLTLGLAAYAYDWPLGRPAIVRSVPEALALARSHGVTVTRDLATANATFDYADDGVAHTVWIADATTWAFAAAAAREAGIRDLALWRAGLEPADLWDTVAARTPYLRPGEPPPQLPRCFLLPR